MELRGRRRRTQGLNLPNHLERGDTIGIVSPSLAVTRELRPMLDSGMKFLEEMGFKAVLAKNALRIDPEAEYSAGTPREKAEDINSMFADRSVKAIITSQGGGTANSCLPFLDWNLIRANPKIFQGISDATVLLNAINATTGLVTFHGSEVMRGFGRKPSRYEREEFVNRLIRGITGKVRRNSQRRTVRGGAGEGRLVGGNVHSIMMLAGTPYFPDFGDSILFLEAYRVAPHQCDYYFTQLKQAGVFDRVKGVVVGHVWSMQEGEKGRRLAQMEDILLRITREYDFPILKMNDFGHECPNTILPIGVKARVDADACDLEIVEKCVA